MDRNATSASVGRLMNPKTRNQMTEHDGPRPQAPVSSAGIHSSATWYVEMHRPDDRQGHGVDTDPGIASDRRRSPG